MIAFLATLAFCLISLLPQGGVAKYRYSFLFLIPILWSSGTGADVMKRIAAPMVGGLVTSFVLELAVYPAIFALWRGRRLARGEPAAARIQSSPESTS